MEAEGALIGVGHVEESADNADKTKGRKPRFLQLDDQMLHCVAGNSIAATAVGIQDKKSGKVDRK